MPISILFNDDCIVGMKNIPDKSVNLICTDLPYGTTSIEWDNIIPFELMWNEFRRVLTTNGTCLLFGSQPFTSKLIMSNLPWFKQSLVWNKNKCGSPGLSKIRPMQTHEDIVVFSPGKTCYNPIMETGEPYKRNLPATSDQPRKNNHRFGFDTNTEVVNTGTRYPKSIINISRDFSAQQQVHPTQKPVSLLTWLIKTYSNENETVLDATMGSGSCGVAAIQNNRNFIGIESDTNFYLLAQGRIQKALDSSCSK